MPSRIDVGLRLVEFLFGCCPGLRQPTRPLELLLGITSPYLELSNAFAHITVIKSGQNIVGLDDASLVDLQLNDASADLRRDPDGDSGLYSARGIHGLNGRTPDETRHGESGREKQPTSRGDQTDRQQAERAEHPERGPAWNSPATSFPAIRVRLGQVPKSYRQTAHQRSLAPLIPLGGRRLGHGLNLQPLDGAGGCVTSQTAPKAAAPRLV